MIGYILDANVFIEAKDRWYGFDFCPAFWDWVVLQNDAGKVASIRRVKEELTAKDDELSEWAKRRAADFFLKEDENVALEMSEVGKWARQATLKNGDHYAREAVDEFLDSSADSWLVAHARVWKCIVVTHETLGNSAKRVKLPNACQGLGIACITPYEMLRDEGARFVLKK